MRVIYKSYYRCANGDLIQGVFGQEVEILTLNFTFNGVRNSDGTYSAAPVWFSQVNDFPLYDTYWLMTPPNEYSGEYNFSWTAANKDGSETEYIVRLTMLDYCNIPLGCDMGTTSKPVSILLWLTREGGWCYFPFNGKKSFEVKIPEAATYITTNYELRQTSRQGVYNGETLSTGDIPELALDLLQSLKESIQVYYVENYFEDGSQIYHPVIIQDGDFVKRKTDERRWDVKVKFIYATERQIQSQ